MKPRILVVDDDAGVRYTLREILEANDHEVHDAPDGRAALAFLAGQKVDLVISDLAMPHVDGMELLRRIAELPDPPRAVLITAHGSERHAVNAIKLGAYDYFSKPFDMDEVVAVVERAVSWQRRERRGEEERAEPLLRRHLVFASDAMRKLAVLVYRVAPRNVTVLLTGQSGTGKELVAEAIVAGSPRADRPFVRFNCAALPREVAEAELFGHARGAFTGAVRARGGLFREADGGTLLLDEIGELDLATQGTLLRVLQEGRVRPVGEDRDHKIDVRLLAATNRDLRQEVALGRFREDLFYRLNVVELRLPPLSERADDVPLLIDHFLRKHAERFGMGPVELAPALRRKLATAVYPGNVRELEHRIQRLVALSSDGVLGEDDLAPDAGLQSGDSSRPGGLKERVEAFERGLIADELARSGGNRSEAARQLGIGRVTLLEKMKKYGLK